MAYAVKYRLEFSDNNEKDKKIEILKKNYTGSVLPIIGTDNPCEITWEGDDDFYSPIKGSKCKLNLFVTDTVSYDNFYEFDEREYQVKISYKDSSNNYQIYWIGWLVVDSFSEAITSKPFTISLTALDGLGTLDSYSMPMDTTTTDFQNARFFITNCLNNLDLELDIYVSQDIFILNPGATVFSIYDVMNIKPYTLQKDKFALNDAKKILEQILKFTNARIFQSFGRWYIINNSSYSAQSIKNSSASTAQGGTIPTGIRAAESASLVANNTESIQYVIYNYLGSYQSTTTIDVLKQVPSQLLPIDNSLTKEYLRPLNEFNITHETSQFLDVNTIKNSGLENGLADWTTYTSTGTTSPGELSTDFTKQGNNSYKNTQAQTNETGTRKTLTTSVDVLSQPFLSNTLKINTYFDTNSGFGSISFRFRVKIEDTSSGQVRYWNSTTGSGWGGSDHINIQSVKTGNVWKEFSYNLENYPISGTLTVDLFEPFVQNSGGLNAIYYDNITLEFKRLENNRETNFFSSIDGFAYQRIRTTGSNLTGVLEFSDLQLSNNNYNNITTTDFIRPRDDNASFIKSVEQIVTQQVINDYRTNLVRYEGKLYNLINDPISLNNKVWINFGSSVLREPVSCYIDGMTYNVIKNSFDVIMHIPNQDDDQTSTFKTTF
tara:strand:- start:6046 stop:8028 length:1983 start_codon:yes stop_codon:yes gene_type:complete